MPEQMMAMVYSLFQRQQTMQAPSRASNIFQTKAPLPLEDKKQSDEQQEKRPLALEDQTASESKEEEKEDAEEAVACIHEFAACGVHRHAGIEALRC